ncbi:MAG: DUF1569 domain-containing protein [Gemmatimonadaceae bacterium]
MKNLLDAATGEEVKRRTLFLREETTPLWGKMNAGQAMAHCATGMEMAVGDVHFPQKMMGKLLGRIIKPMALGDDAPMRRNSPTADGMIINDERDLIEERERVCVLVDRFVKGGRAGCSKYPHPFFGKLTPDEWAILMYKHIDHHLRQFGV